MRTATPRTVAVLDVGKTNVKLVLFDVRAGREAWTRSMPNAVLRDGPYPHMDVAHIEAFLVDGLADLASEAGAAPDAISITTHGATGALIAPDGLALPVLDYEHDGPDTAAEAYDRIRPDFAETFSPRLPGGLNLGAQLFWQARAFPAAFARATAFVTYPQYWAWRLTGVAATEATSLGCHTDLWAPRRDGFSSLVGRMGWGGLMAPLRSAFDVLGPLRPEIAGRIGFGGAVPVSCGIHDSNASLLPHLQGDAGPRTVVSTGTWVIVFAVGGSLERLDPSRDTLANVDVYRRPVPSARFMGGREFDILSGGSTAVPDGDAVAAVIGRGVMALPGFAPGSGPFPTRRGRWTHDPEALSPPERTAAASLYAALMVEACLDLIGAAGPIVVEGPFARNALFCEALAALSGRPVTGAPGGTGTGAGAARLASSAAAGGPERAPLPDAAVHPGLDLAGYAARWRRLIASDPSSNLSGSNDPIAPGDP